MNQTGRGHAHPPFCRLPGIEPGGREFAQPRATMRSWVEASKERPKQDGEEPSGLCGARAGAGARGRASGTPGRRGRVRAGAGGPVRARGAGGCVRRGTRAGVWAAQRVRAARAGSGRATRTGRASPAARALQNRLIIGPWPHTNPRCGAAGVAVCVLCAGLPPTVTGGAGGQRGRLHCHQHSVALSPTQKATLVS